jgi:hypothetical protein
MGRTRSGQDLINDAYKKADLEAFTDRYPRADVLRYINQGGAELWDLLLTARGRAFGRSATPWTITTTANTTTYMTGYPTNFLELLSVRLGGSAGEMLRPLQNAEEAWNQLDDAAATYPMYYELIPGALRLLPAHNAGSSVIVDFVVTFTDLADSLVSLFDGINGWEEFLVCHAAREMMLKEGEPEMARLLQSDKDKLEARIMKRAPKRDAFQARRARDVRGEQMMGRSRLIWNGRWR